MAKTPEPTNAGMIHFYETIRPVLLKKYNLVVTATLTEFEIRFAGSGKIIAVGDSIKWLAGFVNGLDALHNQLNK